MARQAQIADYAIRIAQGLAANSSVCCHGTIDADYVVSRSIDIATRLVDELALLDAPLGYVGDEDDGEEE